MPANCEPICQPIAQLNIDYFVVRYDHMVINMLLARRLAQIRVDYADTKNWLARTHLFI